MRAWQDVMVRVDADPERHTFVCEDMEGICAEAVVTAYQVGQKNLGTNELSPLIASLVEKVRNYMLTGDANGTF